MPKISSNGCGRSITASYEPPRTDAYSRREGGPGRGRAEREEGGHKKKKNVDVVFVPPKKIPPQHLGVLTPSMINAIARGIHIKLPQTYKQYPALFPKNKKPLFTTPLHFHASHDSWEHTIYSIRHFHHLPIVKQSEEHRKKHSIGEKRYLWRNRDRLNENRPPPLVGTCPPSKGMSQRQWEKQGRHLTHLSTERASSSLGKSLGSTVLAAPCGDVFLCGPSISVPTLNHEIMNRKDGIACVKCGFQQSEWFI